MSSLLQIPSIVLMTLWLLVYGPTAAAQGIATWVGDRVGLGNAGRAIDNANREVKKVVPLYGQAEQAVTAAGRQLITESVVETSAPILKNLILASRQDALNAGAGPLPQEVIWEFTGFYSKAVLSAYWRIGQGNELSLQANAFRFGDRAAIALDTVLVFRSGQEANSVWLWAHELAHIEQYRMWGIDDFTKRYIRNSDEIEAAANRRADEFMAFRASRSAGQASVSQSTCRSNPSLGPPLPAGQCWCAVNNSTPQSFCPTTAQSGPCTCARYAPGTFRGPGTGTIVGYDAGTVY